jgi:hypothetical protein
MDIGKNNELIDEFDEIILDDLFDSGVETDDDYSILGEMFSEDE